MNKRRCHNKQLCERAWGDDVLCHIQPVHCNFIKSLSLFLFASSLPFLFISLILSSVFVTQYIHSRILKTKKDLKRMPIFHIFENLSFCLFFFFFIHIVIVFFICLLRKFYKWISNECSDAREQLWWDGKRRGS